MGGYQEYDISTGEPIRIERLVSEAQDVIRSCATEMINLIESESNNQTVEEKANLLSQISSMITFELRRIKNAIEVEKYNAANHSSQTNP